jgi:molybdopterin converting factor small subunit
VKVKLFGTLRRLSQPGTPGLWQGDLPEGTTVKNLFDLLGAGKYEVYTAAINGNPCTFDDDIPDGAEVILVTPVGGG